MMITLESAEDQTVLQAEAALRPHQTIHRACCLQLRVLAVQWRMHWDGLDYLATVIAGKSRLERGSTWKQSTANHALPSRELVDAVHYCLHTRIPKEMPIPYHQTSQAPNAAC